MHKTRSTSGSEENDRRPNWSGFFALPVVLFLVIVMDDAGVPGKEVNLVGEGHLISSYHGN